MKFRISTLYILHLQKIVRNVKHTIILSICLGISLKILSQSKDDLGISLGAGYYMGDINPVIPFYAPGIDLGIIYRHNLNMRHVIKFDANYVRLRAIDADFNDDYQQRRNATFATPAFDFALQFEFNFLPLKFAPKKFSLSPYVSAGIGTSFATRSQVKSLMFTLPFSIGVRTTLGRYWSMGMGWNYRKLFNDKLDGIENEVPNNMKSILHNNDWYSFLNIFITYKVFTTKQECAAYNTK